MEIKDRLKHARKQKYKTQSDFCKETGVPIGTYRAHEGGYRGIKEPVARHYADLLDVDWIWLYTGKGTPQDSSKVLDDKVHAIAMRKAEEIFTERGLDLSDIEAKSYLAGHLYKALINKSPGESISNDLIDHLVETLPLSHKKSR